MGSRMGLKAPYSLMHWIIYAVEINWYKAHMAFGFLKRPLEFYNRMENKKSPRCYVESSQWTQNNLYWLSES